MNILIFLVILALLVLVHEFGHFIIAKKNGVRVDEFGLGFPPRIFGKKIGETVYSLNIVPFGGFVKIFGENAESLETLEGIVEDPSRSLVHKKRSVQAAVLSGGVLFNIIFAWLIISLGLVWGLPTAVDSTNTAEISDTHLVISSVLPGSPAEKSNLKAGDLILSLKTDTASLAQNVNPDTVRDFIKASHGEIAVSYRRGSQTAVTQVQAKAGITTEGSAIGIGMDQIGTMKLPFYKAFFRGGILTVELFKTVAFGIIGFLRDIIFGHADLSQVSGPVGMVSMVGDARSLGFGYLIFFTALLSINLAVINLIPFPALDGGRLFVILIETIKRSPLKPKFIQTLNTVGFGLLILLMLAVTYHDILKLF